MCYFFVNKMQIADIARVLEHHAPPQLAENYDNVGLLVGEANEICNGVLVCLDVTEAVLAEALEKNCNLIVSHHPIWFGGKKKLTGIDYSSRVIMQAIRKNIALYAIHTNLDNIFSGVNKKICDKIGLTDCQILQPMQPNTPDMGAGMIGSFVNPMSRENFLAHICNVFQLVALRYALGKPTKIQKVAVCGGAGAFLISVARKMQVDAFITADITYHKFFDAEAELLLLDIGHFESEQYTTELLFDFLKEKFPNLWVCASNVNTNPMQYYIYNSPK